MMKAVVILLALVACCLALGPGVYTNPVPRSELFFFGNDLVIWVPDYGFETTLDLDAALYQCSIATSPKAPHGFRICTNLELTVLGEQTTYADSLINECFWSFEQANQNSFGMFCFADQYDPYDWVATRVFSIDDVFSAHINGLGPIQVAINGLSLSVEMSGGGQDTRGIVTPQQGAYVACCASNTFKHAASGQEPENMYYFGAPS